MLRKVNFSVLALAVGVLAAAQAAGEHSRRAPESADTVAGLLIPTGNSGFLVELENTPTRRWSAADMEQGWQRVSSQLRDAGVLEAPANSLLQAARKITRRGPNGSQPVFNVPVFVEAARVKQQPVWVLGLGWGTDYGRTTSKSVSSRVEAPTHYWVLVLDGRAPHRILGQTNCN
jgi:hypothetical protein